MKKLEPAGHLRAGDSDAPIPNDGTHWLNDLYYVRVIRSGACQILSIKPNDGARHDWREFQWMKNQLCGPECEAVEVYPAETRLVDTANQYYLLVLPPGLRFTFGFVEREVSELLLTSRSTQRPFPPGRRPGDLMTIEQMRAKAATPAGWATGPIFAVNHAGEPVAIVGDDILPMALQLNRGPKPPGTPDDGSN